MSPTPPALECLEPRRLFHGDLGVSIRSTTLPDSIAVGIPNKPSIARIAVSNTNSDGHPIDKASPPVPLTVALRDAEGNVRTLGATTVKVPNLKSGASRTVAVKLALPVDLSPGTYTLFASIAPPADLGDTTPNDNTASGKTVVASAASSDLSLTASTNVSASVASGSTARVRTAFTNTGNTPSKAVATLEITSTIGGTTTVLSTVRNVRLNVAPGRTFSAKPVSVTLSGSGSSATSVTLGARIASVTGLVNDLTTNNTATAATLTVQPAPPAPPSPFGDAAGISGTVTFNRTRRVGALGNFNETGTFTDSTGRAGKYTYTLVTAGIVRYAILFSSNNNTPLLTGQFNTPVDIAGKTLTFSTNPANSAGTFAAQGTTFNYRFGR